MRKLIIVLIALIPFVSNCTKNDYSDSLTPIRVIAWNYLSAQAKSTVIADWKQAPVNESTYNGISAYIVTFNTSDDALLGPIIIYIDVSTKVVLGQALRM